MTKPLTIRDAVRFLTLHDPDLTNEQVQERLEWLGMSSCTTFLISSIRTSFRDDMRFLERAGLLRNRTPLIPARIRHLKPPKVEPVKGYYRWGDD